MTSLITGGAGFIGSTLAHTLVERGEDVVLLVRTVRQERLGDILDKVKIEQGDVGVFAHVFNAVKTYKVKNIYHTGAMLSKESENNPWGAFQTNIIGLYNMLEAARLLDVERMMFTSSTAVFGMGVGPDIYDTTPQRPHDMYGISKQFGEGMGKFYRRKFGLDFRSIRFPGVIGPGALTPGHWELEMIEHAFNGEPYECPYPPETKLSIIWYKDAARAADMVLRAPRENIQMINYNITGLPGMVSAGELAEGVKKFIPGARITFSKTPLPLPFYSFIKVLDDEYARKEWGWKPELTTLDQVLGAFINELKMRKN
jgi:threonine 3-dehydrogenase